MEVADVIRYIVEIGISPVMVLLFFQYFTQQSRIRDAQIQEQMKQSQIRIDEVTKNAQDKIDACMAAAKEREDLRAADFARREELIKSESNSREKILRQEAEKREGILMTNMEKLSGTMDAISRSMQKIELSSGNTEMRLNRIEEKLNIEWRRSDGQACSK